MKKLSKFLVTLLLMLGSGIALAQDDVWIVVPDDGDTVNSSGFTLVAKAQGEFDEHQYMVQIVLFNERNADLQDAYVFPTGTIYSGGPYILEFITPKPSDLDGTNPKGDTGTLPLVIHVRDLIEDDPYYLAVGLWNLDTGLSTGDYTFVQTK